MSVEDVCELGSMLQSEDEEKCLLERKLVELDGAIQTQDRRLNHEVEAEQWALSEQSNLLERAVNTGNNFEIASSIISQLRYSTISTPRLSDVLGRVQAYIVLKEDLADDIDKVNNEMKRLQGLSSNLDDIKRKRTFGSVPQLKNLGVDSTAKLMDLRQSVATIKDDMKLRRILRGENVDRRNTIFEKLYPAHQNSKQTIENKTRDLADKSCFQQNESNVMLTTLRGEIDAVVLLIDGLVANRVTALIETQTMLSRQKEGELSLASIRDNISDSRGKSISSSEVEQTVSSELAEAKKKLVELDRLSGDRCDELERMKRAQAFEQAREEAFLKSQAVNNLSNHQTCKEAERLAASLETVRAKIAQVMKQISHDANTFHDDSEWCDGVPHERLQQLNALRCSSLKRRDTIQANNELKSERVSALEDCAHKMIAVGGSMREEADFQRLCNKALSTDHRDTLERLRPLKETLEHHSTSRQLEVAMISINADALQLQIEIHHAEAGMLNALKLSSDMAACLTEHVRHVETYSSMRNSRFILTEKDRRLRVTRQDKILQCERSLEVLQSELQREDEKFKEAVKAAENDARLTEEKLVAAMNQVIEDGKQIIAERDYRNEEIKQLRNSLKIIDEEHAIEMEILGDTIAAESLPPQPSRRTSSLPRSALVNEVADNPCCKKVRKRSLGDFRKAYPSPSSKLCEDTDGNTLKSSRAMGQYEGLTFDHNTVDLQPANGDFDLSKPGLKQAQNKSEMKSLSGNERGSFNYKSTFSGIDEAPSRSPGLYQNMTTSKRAEKSKDQNKEAREVQHVTKSIEGSKRGLAQRSHPQDRDQSVQATYTVSASTANKKLVVVKQRTTKSNQKPK